MLARRDVLAVPSVSALHAMQLSLLMLRLLCLLSLLCMLHVLCMLTAAFLAISWCVSYMQLWHARPVGKLVLISSVAPGRVKYACHIW